MTGPPQRRVRQRTARPRPTAPAPSTPQARSSARPGGRRPHPRRRLLADPDARLREHDRRRGGQQRRRRQGDRLPPLVAQGGPRGRGDGAALPRRDALPRHRLDPRRPAVDVRLGARLRELPGRHRLRAHHHQGVDARRPHRHALPRGQPPRRSRARPRSSSAPSQRGEVRADIPVRGRRRVPRRPGRDARHHRRGHAGARRGRRARRLRAARHQPPELSASPGRAGRPRTPRGRTAPGRRDPRRDPRASRVRRARAAPPPRCRPWPTRRAW